MKPHELQSDKAKNALHTASVICILQKKPYMQVSFAMNSGLLDLCARRFPIPFLERASGESARRGSFSPASFIHNGPSSRRAKRIQQICFFKNTPVRTVQNGGANRAERGREPCRTGARTVQKGARTVQNGARTVQRARARTVQNGGTNRAEQGREPCRTEARTVQNGGGQKPNWCQKEI